MSYELSAPLSEYPTQSSNPLLLASYSAPPQTSGLGLLLCTANTLEVHDFNPARSYKTVLYVGKFTLLELIDLFFSTVLC